MSPLTLSNDEARLWLDELERAAPPLPHAFAVIDSGGEYKVVGLDVAIEEDGYRVSGPLMWTGYLLAIALLTDAGGRVLWQGRKAVMFSYELDIPPTPEGAELTLVMTP